MRWWLVSGDTDNASFAIVGDELRTAAVFDFETKDTYSVRVETTDGSLSLPRGVHDKSRSQTSSSFWGLLVESYGAGQDRGVGGVG